jgi:glycosyltransferase involved in cell wall biosynthesis
MHGIFPEEYVLEPHKWSPADAYVQMDRFTYEEFLPDELSFVVVLLPPLQFEGVRLKGLFCAPGVDAIRQIVPSVSDTFITIANTRWASYPWSVHADGYFGLYNNTARINHFRATRPELRHIQFIPRQTADHTNETKFVPRPNIEKDIDIVVIARLHAMKHLPFLSKAIQALAQRSPTRRYRVVWAGPGIKSDDRIHPRGLKILREMESSLGRMEDYIEQAGWVDSSGMPALYARSKVFVLASTVEGKNRALSEAMLSDVPAVVLDDFNAAARGDQPILPKNAGLVVPRDPEQLAEGLARAVENYGDFTPRAEYLKVSGRMNSFWDCVLGFEHFSRQIPGQTREEREQWLDAALASNYGIASVRDFLYKGHSSSPFAAQYKLKSMNNAHGKDDIKQLLDAYATLNQPAHGRASISAPAARLPGSEEGATANRK